MALPGELESQYGSDPGYQAYKAWARGGTPATWWTSSAAEAAQAAGIPRENPAYANIPHHQIQTAWGEGKEISDVTGEEIHDLLNPAWTDYVNRFMAGTMSGNPVTNPVISPTPQPQFQSPVSTVGGPQIISTPMGYEIPGIEAQSSAGIFSRILDWIGEHSLAAGLGV